MDNGSYYWQGGRKIEIEQEESAATIHADSLNDVEAAAAAAGVSIRESAMVGPGLVRLEISQDRDSAIDQLRDRHIVHHVYHTKGQPDSEVLIYDSFFAKFKQTVTRARMEEYIAREKLELVDVYDDRTMLLRVTDETGMNPIKAANAAAQSPLFEYAEPNILRKLDRFGFLPLDDLFSLQWHLHAPADGDELVAGTDVRAPDAWDVTLGLRDIVVAVADDGCDVTHPDFQGANKLAGAVNVIPSDDGINVSFDDRVMPQAGDYHGTPCSGVAVAEHNGVGTLGVAPGCSLLPVRFPLSLSEAQLARMFDRISPHADVLSCSWGIGPADAPLSRMLSDKIANLSRVGGRRGKGLVFVVAAGNNNCPVKDLNNTTLYQFLTPQGIFGHSGPIDRWIAAHPDVITVSAITSENKRSAYSSWGDQISVCAPSNNFHDLRSFAVPGLGIWTTDNEGAGPGSDFSSGSRYTGSFGGTSSATPTVAGVCALVLSLNPNLSAEEVRSIVERTANKDLRIESDTPVNRTGEFDTSGFSPWYGFGRVDAFAAVNEASSLVDQHQLVRFAAADVPVSIPDSGAPVVSDVEIGVSGLIAELRVGVRIAHTYIGDLRLDLVSPTGAMVNLRNSFGGGQQDLDATFTSQDVPGLAGFVGQPIGGHWLLRVVDTARFDTGAIEHFEIVARVSAPA